MSEWLDVNWNILVQSGDAALLLLDFVSPKLIKN